MGPGKTGARTVFPAGRRKETNCKYKQLFLQMLCLPDFMHAAHNCQELLPGYFAVAAPASWPAGYFRRLAWFCKNDHSA